VPELIRGVDAVVLRVPDLAAGIRFYQRLGHRLLWQTETQAGLSIGETELVVSVAQDAETDLLVDDVPAALERFRAAGGTVIVGPVDIPVGRLAVVLDPFGNRLSLIDLSKGRYRVDQDKRVVGVRPVAD
jgi:catechol 2,3-dioxygenase-like lactoylglutathione lyase family enzyme